MGAIKFFSSSSFDNSNNYSSCDNKNERINKDINPNPENYKIIKSLKRENFLVVFINYPDCINYEGNKILIFENCGLNDLKNQNIIDPHFSNNKSFHSPIMRLEPTEKGWSRALNIIDFLIKTKG
jgi:hypothetical protein